jgi:transporter family-2 protein
MDFLWAMLAGAVVPIQAGINAHLKNFVGHAAISVFISVVTSVVFVGLYILVARLDLSGFSHWREVPWWAWTGGVFGALLLIGTTTLAPRLGSVALVGCVIAGQIIASMLLDQFGLFGFKQHSLNVGRLAGIGLLGSGVFLVLKY